MSQRIQEPPEAGKTRKWFSLGASVGTNSDGPMTSGPQNCKRAIWGMSKHWYVIEAPKGKWTSRNSYVQSVSMLHTALRPASWD